MDKKSVGEHTGFRLIVMTAVFVAATLSMSIVIPSIPIPGTHGNINLCDAGILVSALLLGPRVGGVVGALSGFLLDILTGYSNYSIFSFIVHGLEGLIAGWLSVHLSRKYSAIFATICAVIIMVVGYFFADSILYTFAAGFLGIFTNIIQGIVGAAIALFVTPFLKSRVTEFTQQ